MGYRTLRACIDDLMASGQLIAIDSEVDPHLEAAEIQRRVYAAGGPAILFNRVRGCRFPMVSNLLGTMARARYIFRDTLADVQRLIALKSAAGGAMPKPWEVARLAPAAWRMRPQAVRSGPAMAHETTISELPQLQSWPRDGGSFITLPLVYTESPEQPGWRKSNLGMYRVQLSGGQYQPNREVGLHYQIHRGIGVHHAQAESRGESLKACIWVGGAPAMTLSAVMPLPEGLPELSFAGVLAGHRIPLIERPQRLPIYAEADFCIVGTVDPTRLLPEGPFGDHLGYYSLAHDFPVLKVEAVYHRPGAVWPFTVVGRPPQEDTVFGELIHELTGPVIPTVVAGLKAVHAVDAAGVHPLLLAIGSERYTPYQARRRPQELLTIANAVLGQGQLSLAKYLFIVAQEDDPALDIHDIPAFFRHLLARVDWQRDLHFQTCTTMDTLDYSGGTINEGSKLVIAAVGLVRRELPKSVPAMSLPSGFGEARSVLPGVLVVQGPTWQAPARQRDAAVEKLAAELPVDHAVNQFPVIIVVDDAEFAARTLGNFLWVTFTRSNPAVDVHGIGSFVSDKHWGCRGSLVIDARAKLHHAPPLIEDPAVTRKVDALAGPGGPLQGVI